jgi:hypothetical protein
MENSNTFSLAIEAQLNLNKNGIYEVFVRPSELAAHWGTTHTGMDIMTKMFVPVFDGEYCHLCSSKGRAIRELLDMAGVETLEDLN